MKINKLKYSLILPLLLVSTSCKDNKSLITLIGADIYSNSQMDVFTKVADETKLEYNNALSQKKRDYRDDLKLLETNPSIYYNGSKTTVKKILKKTKILFFSFDYKSVLINYDTTGYESMNHDLSLWDYYIHQINEELIDIYSGKVVMLSLFNDTNDKTLTRYIETFNNSLKEKCEEYEVTYIDTSYLSSYIENLEINSSGLTRLYKELQEAIIWN